MVSINLNPLLANRRRVPAAFASLLCPLTPPSCSPLRSSLFRPAASHARCIQTTSSLFGSAALLTSSLLFTPFSSSANELSFPPHSPSRPVSLRLFCPRKHLISVSCVFLHGLIQISCALSPTAVTTNGQPFRQMKNFYHINTAVL